MGLKASIHINALFLYKLTQLLAFDSDFEYSSIFILGSSPK